MYRLSPGAVPLHIPGTARARQVQCPAPTLRNYALVGCVIHCSVYGLGDVNALHCQDFDSYPRLQGDILCTLGRGEPPRLCPTPNSVSVTHIEVRFGCMGL